MQTLILPQKSKFNLVIWYSPFKVICYTYPNHGHGNALEGVTTFALYQKILQNIQTSHPHQMYQSTKNVEYWDTWWISMPKQKTGDFSKMG